MKSWWTGQDYVPAFVGVCRSTMNKQIFLLHCLIDTLQTVLATSEGAILVLTLVPNLYSDLCTAMPLISRYCLLVGYNMAFTVLCGKTVGHLLLRPGAAFLLAAF